jgi:Leucine-rich repeat (LRR) protein
MVELTALYLFEEKALKTLPKSIGGLENLQILNAPYNALTELPESVGGLKSLRRLWLYCARF